MRGADAELDLVGKTFEGRYAIEGALGAGGCGAVYRARQAPLGRTVALKVLHPSLAERPSEVVRFQREAQAVAALTTPHAVKLIDFGVAEEGQLFMVMELIEGESLRALLRREGRLAPARVVRLLTQIAECLAEAHARGITHRDIKPENIHLATVGARPDGDFVKVLDFGIARLADEAGAMTSLTKTGAAIGSPLYMAPEQATARKDLIGPATDVYAVGVMGYELVTGRVPFYADNVTNLLLAHVHEAPAWPTIPGGGVVPDALARLLMACLSKAVTGRPASGGDLLAALRALPLDASWERRDSALSEAGSAPILVDSTEEDHAVTMPAAWRLAGGELARTEQMSAPHALVAPAPQPDRAPSAAASGAPEREPARPAPGVPSPSVEVPPGPDADLAPRKAWKTAVHELGTNRPILWVILLAIVAAGIVLGLLLH